MNKSMPTYVMDTNVLLTDGFILNKLDKLNVIVPLIVIQELDKHKTDAGETGLHARRAIRSLNELMLKGNLVEGVQAKDALFVKVIPSDDTDLTPDDQIIAIAKKLSTKTKKAKIMSNDVALRVKANIIGVASEEYKSGQMVQTDEDLFSGLKYLSVPGTMIDKLYQEGSLDIPEYAGLLQPHEFVNLRSEINDTHTALGRMCTDGKIRKLAKIKDTFGIHSKNVEQACALELLLDKNVPLVTLMGKAGTGKTLLALAACLELVVSKKEYQKIIILRSPIPMGRDIGFLPGTLEEKMDVWAGPIYDSLKVLMGDTKHTLEYFMDQEIIEIGPPTFIRGRSLKDCIVLVDEAQSLSRHEMKTIATRMAENSKLIVTGDVYQIDNPQLSAVDNGFSHLVEKFKPEVLSGHMKLTKCERSDLAARAAELL